MDAASLMVSECRQGAEEEGEIGGKRYQHRVKAVPGSCCIFSPGGLAKVSG